MQTLLASIKRIGTSPGGQYRSTRTESRNQSLNSSPSTHATRSQTAKRIRDRRSTNIPRLPEASRPSLHSAIMTSSDTSSGIETLAWQSGALLDIQCGEHNAGEGVREVQTEEPADEVCEGAELGDGHGDYEGEDPVERARPPPEVFAALA